MNYGHSFGHAIESATDFLIPHGIAVTIGMDIANYVACRFGTITESQYLKMKTVLKDNYAGFDHIHMPHDAFFKALSKDKKNTGAHLKLILPGIRTKTGN